MVIHRNNNEEIDVIFKTFDQIFRGDAAGFIARYVPQYTTSDSAPRIIKHIENIKEITPFDPIAAFLSNIDFRGDYRPSYYGVEKKNIYTKTFSIIFNDEINIGIFIAISTTPISDRKIEDFTDQIKDAISLRKKSAAVESIAKLSNSLPRRNAINFERFIGENFQDAMKCADVLMVRQVPGSSTKKYSTIFSTSGKSIEIPPGNSAIAYCASSGNILRINDIFSKETRPFKINNTIMMKNMGFKSLICKTIKFSPEDLHIAIICFYKREYAISSIEQELFDLLTLCLEGQVSRERPPEVIKDIKGEKLELLLKNSLMIADVMHDATEDLIVARNNLSSAVPKRKGEEEKLELSKRILEDVISAATLFKEGVSASKTIFGIRRNRRQDFSPRELVKDILTKVSLSGDYKNIVIQNELPASLTVKGAKYALKSAFDNAIKNSIYHLHDVSHRKRLVRIYHKMVPDTVIFHVWDNGPGMTKEEAKMSTEVLHSTTEGMGLGMSIIESCARSHGGSLSIDSVKHEYCCVKFSLAL